MKTILALGILVIAITTLYASLNFPPYNKSKPPSISLPVAYEHAIVALGSATNQFHCVSANVTTTFSSDGEWYFTFHSTNSQAAPKLIAVEFNGKVIFDNGWR